MRNSSIRFLFGWSSIRIRPLPGHTKDRKKRAFLSGRLNLGGRKNGATDICPRSPPTIPAWPKNHWISAISILFSENLMNMEKQIKRHTIRTMIYYALTVPTVCYFVTSKKFRGGPCTPSLDALSFVFAGAMSASLTIYNLIIAGIRKKEYLIPAAIHLFALLIWYYFLHRVWYRPE